MKKTCFVLFLLLTFAAWGRTPKELVLERSGIKMEAEGIEFKPFKDMKAEQIKPLNSHSFTRKLGSTVERVSGYDYDAMWRRGQKVATYYSPSARVEFYKLNYLPPKVSNLIMGKYVNENEYNKNLVMPEKRDLTFMNAWFKAFRNQDIKLVDKYPKLTFAFQQKWVEMSQSDGQFDFLILTKDKRLLYLHAKIDAGTAAEQEEAMKYFIKQIRIGRPQAVKSSNQSSKVKPIGKVSSAYEQTIKKVIQEVANTEGWWYAQTKNYILKSNLPSKSKTFAKKIQQRVEVMRSVYEKFIPPIDSIEAVSVITVPATRQEYVSYSGAPDWSAGVWNSSRRELVVSQLNGSKKTAEYYMMTTLHHEAFHQYIYYALNEIQTPAWFNEGHADLFAAVKVTGSKVKTIEDVNHMRTLASSFSSRRLSLERLINSSYMEFYANKDINYAFAWSVVYFIRKAGEQFKGKNYEKILPNLMAELIKTRSMQAANKKAFEGIDMKTFQNDYYDFWNDKRARSKAERNVIIPK